MGYGGSVEEVKELHLKTLKKLYGDKPHDELIVLAREEMKRRMDERRNRITA